MSDASARRDFRYAARISVALVSRNPDVNLVTENVSYRGLFLRTNDPLPKMRLLQVRITLPSPFPVLRTHAVVMYVAGVGTPFPGMGVSFFGLDSEQRKEWEKYVQSVRDEQSARQSVAQPAVVTKTKHIEKSLGTAVQAEGARQLGSMAFRPQTQSFAPGAMG